jgi:endonuclease I
MGFKIYLTEKQLDVVLKNLMLVEYEEKPTKKYAKQARQAVEEIISIELKGNSVFKNGEDIVNPNNPQVIKLLTDLKALKSNTTIEATVNGSSTNTGFNNFKKGSEGAKKLNIGLAERRRDNLIKYLQQNILSNINFIKGTATMSDNEDVNSRSASVDIKTFGMAATTINVDRDNTSFIPRDLYKTGLDTDFDPDVDPLKVKVLKNVSIEIPEAWVSDYKQTISKWAFNKNGKKSINLKLKITTPLGL